MFAEVKSMSWYRKTVKPRKNSLVGVIKMILRDKIDLQQQDENYSCGNAAIQNLYRILKLEIPSEDSLEMIMGTTPSTGTDPSQLAKYLTDNHIPFQPFKNHSIEEELAKNNVILAEYQDYLEERSPEEIQQKTASHFAIIVGFDKDYFYIIDSLLPKEKDTNSAIKKVLKAKFIQNWKARSFDGSTIMKQWGLIVPVNSQ